MSGSLLKLMNDPIEKISKISPNATALQDETFNEFYKLVLDRSALITITDSRGIITYANDMFCVASGYSEEELIGQKHNIVKSNVHSKDFFVNLWETILSGKSWSGEICNRSKTGKLFWIDTIIVPYHNEKNEIESYIAIRRNITKRVLHQVELDKALKNIQEAVETKTMLFSTVSHEIRTSLNGIIGMINLLSQTELNREQSEFIEAIRRSSDILFGIINDVLDFSKLETGHISLDNAPFNLYEKMLGVLAPYEISSSGHGVRFKVDLCKPERMLIADSTKIIQITNNLLSNAVKFTSKGVIKVSVETVDQNLVITVCDTGIGIARKNHKKLFKIFSQADSSTTRNYGGSGLGLSISKQLAILLGGDVTFKSKQNVGSTFTLTIPFEWGEVIDTKNARHTNISSFAHGRVLVAEDNTINQMVIKKTLQSWGIDSLIVANGQEAIEELKKHDFDLVLMDCNMPIMDGHDATKNIRQSDFSFSKIPIVALTATASTVEKNRCITSGMDGYLSKPLKNEDLQTILSRYITPSSQSEPVRSFEESSEEALYDPSGLDSMGDKEFSRELTEQFLLTIPDHMEDILDGLGKGDIQRVKQICHQIRPGAMSVGAILFSRLLEDMEEYAIDNDLNEMLTCQEELFNVYDETIRLINVYHTVDSEETIGITILSVEDDPNAQVMMKHAFKKYEEIELNIVSNVESALGFLHENNTTLLLLDSFLGDDDGIELFHKIREVDRFKSLPVIFVTADIDPERLMKYEQLDILGLINKPINPNSFAEEVISLFKKNKI